MKRYLILGILLLCAFRLFSTEAEVKEEGGKSSKRKIVDFQIEQIVKNEKFKITPLDKNGEAKFGHYSLLMTSLANYQVELKLKDKLIDEYQGILNEYELRDLSYAYSHHLRLVGFTIAYVIVGIFLLTPFLIGAIIMGVMASKARKKLEALKEQYIKKLNAGQAGGDTAGLKRNRLRVSFAVTG